MKTSSSKMGTFSLSIIAALIFQCSGPSEDKVCPDAKCDDYATREVAQAAFDHDRDCLGELDSDNDGLACEHLPSSGGSNGGSPGGSTGGSGCPTTSNCGCSNKTQSQCASNCCKWVVGSGCRCK